MARISNGATPRVVALMAGGALLAASAALLSMAKEFPHPWQVALVAAVTVLLALGVATSVLGLPGRDRRGAVLQFGAFTLAVVALPLVRYIPFVFTFVYLRDVESLFPPLWPYSASIPLLFALLGELALSHRPRTAPVVLVVASVVPAGMLLFVAPELTQALAASYESFALPWRVLLAMAVCIAASASIVLGAVAATRGLVWVGVGVLMVTGLLLEMGSTSFYAPYSPKLFDLGLPSLSPWVAFFAGTLPGALTLLLGAALVAANASQRRRAGPVSSSNTEIP